MKPTFIFSILIASCPPAMADGLDRFHQQICEQTASLHYMGTLDGAEMYPLVDGVDEAITGVNAGGDLVAERLAASAYLSGYAVGLVQANDPAESTVLFFDACMSESV